MNSGGGGGGEGGSGSGSGSGMIRSASPFTVSQWQELEHQALIFKYIIAGMPVPPDLVLPIQKSFENISNRFSHHTSWSYCSLYGKKVDLEPGRCRRTDGKKWRCSKEAYQDSKYCERHMHRGRNRSRKPVESQNQQQTSSTTTHRSSSSSSSTVTSPSFAVSGNTGTFQNFPLHSFGNVQVAAPNSSRLGYNNVESIPFGVPSKDYRCLQGLKADLGERSFFNNASGSNDKNPEMNLGLDNAWPMIQSRVSSYPTSKTSFQSDYPASSYFNIDFASGEASKQDGQSLRPFFDEWPKTRDSWSGLEEERSNHTSLSTTQLSISIPMASSDFSATSSRSPHDP